MLSGESVSISFEICAWLAHPVALLGVPGFVAWMNRFQIPAEERAIGALFGEEFEQYRARVRRWI